MVSSIYTNYQLALNNEFKWSLPVSIDFTGITSNIYAMQPKGFHLFYFRNFQLIIHQYF
jgi:hypothetical protein